MAEAQPVTANESMNILASGRAVGELKGRLPPTEEWGDEMDDLMMNKIKDAGDNKQIRRLATLALKYINSLEQDRSKIPQADWDDKYKEQVNRIKQLHGRLVQNEQDDDAATQLQMELPALRRVLDEVIPSPALQKKRAPEKDEGAEEPGVEIEAALKTREPKNIMEVVEGIMDNADKEDFKEGGKYALVRYVPCRTQFGETYKDQSGREQEFKRPVFVPENYVRWFRDRMLTIRDDFSPNKHENYWTGISINMGFRTMNFLKMYDLASAWKEQELRKGIDKDGKEFYWVDIAKDKKGSSLNAAKLDKRTGRPTFLYDKEKTTDLKGLKDEITSTVTMTNYIYRNDTLIRPGAGSETDFAKGYYSAMENNELTKNAMGTGYGHMYFLNEASNYEIGKIKSGDAPEVKQRGKVGKATQIATLLYYNLKHIDKFDNHYMYFDYEKVKRGKYADPKTGKQKEGVTHIITKTGKEYEVNPEDGTLKHPDQAKRLGENMFDKILDAPVDLEMGLKKTISIDGAKAFYGSMARKALTEEFEKHADKIKQDIGEEEYTKIKDAITKANAASIDWLSSINDADEESFAKRIRPKIIGTSEDNKDNNNKGMDDVKWNETWKTIQSLPGTVVDMIKPHADTKVKDALGQYEKGQGKDARKKFAFDLLQAEGTIEKASALNLFDSPHKSKAITDYVRGAVVDVIRAKTDMENIDDAKFADFLNNMLWDTFMIYGLNDTGYVGFRGYSKVMNLRGYRRKSVDYRSEKNGNLFDIDDIKGLLLDPLRAWRVSPEGKEEFGNNKSFLHEVQGGTGNDVNLNDMKRFSFQVGTEKQYAGDPVGNSAKVYQALVNAQAIDFLKDLSWGPNGEIQRGSGWQNMMELLHDLRYSLDRDYPYEEEIEEWYQDQEGEWHVRNIKDTNMDKDKDNKTRSTISTRRVMFSDNVINMDMYKGENFDGDERFAEKDATRKMGRNLFFFIMQRWILARRISSSALKPISRAEIELIRTAYKTFPTAWKNKNGRQVAVDFMLMADEWNRIEKGDKKTGLEGFHTKQTRGVDFVENRWVQGVGGFVGQTGIAVRDLAKLLLRTDWH